MTHHLLESDDAGVQTVSYEHSLFIKNQCRLFAGKRYADPFTGIISYGAQVQ